MRRRLPVVFVVGFGLLSVWVRVATAQSPATNPDSPQTTRDWLPFYRSFYDRYLIQPYRARVPSNQPGFAEGPRLVEATAAIFSSAWADHPRYRDPNAPTVEARRRLAEEVISARCGDPLVTVLAASVLWGNTMPASPHDPRIDAAVKRLLETDYPTETKLMAIDAAAYAARQWLPDWLPVEADVYQHHLTELMVPLMAADRYQSKDRQLVRRLIAEGMTFLEIAGRAAFVKRLDPKACDPWIHSLTEADVLIAQAWQARGGGYANTVTEDGWKTFHACNERATTLLLQAYAAEPTFVESTGRLVALARDGCTEESPRVCSGGRSRSSSTTHGLTKSIPRRCGLGTAGR